MPNDDARITFDGLMLFCFSGNPSKRSPDKRSRCEIGIHTQTDADAHEFKIQVEKEPLRGGALVPVDLESAGVSGNVIIFSQADLRTFASFHLYRGSLNQRPPITGSVIREKSFDGILDLEGEDFYQGQVAVVSGKYTVLFVTTGSFAGIYATRDAEYARVSQEVLGDILKGPGRPKYWDNLLDPDRRLLASYFRKVETKIGIAKGKFLVFKGVTKSGEVKTIFSLPHPRIVEAKRYVIAITHLDKKHSEYKKRDATTEIKKCGAFIHHSLAVKPSNPRVKKRYGLTLNFDFVDLTKYEQGEVEQRCDDACCIICRLGLSRSISSERKAAAKKAAKKKIPKKRTTKKGKAKK